MIRELDYNSECFNERAEECRIEEELVEDLKETLKAHPERTYLCANEVGVPKRMFAVKFDEDVLVFSNPIYQHRGEFGLIREKEPSTDKEYIIPRCKDVTICYQNEKSEPNATKFKEDASIVISQAMDCIDGIHAFDYGLEIIPEFDEATEEERMELIKVYLNSLKDLDYTLDKVLSEDDDTKLAWKDFKFNRALATGEIERDKEPVVKPNREQRRFWQKLQKRLAKKGKTINVS